MFYGLSIELPIQKDVAGVLIQEVYNSHGVKNGMSILKKKKKKNGMSFQANVLCGKCHPDLIQI